MSARAMAWAFTQMAKLKSDGTGIGLLLKLADQANDDGIAWPSRETLARQLGVSTRTISDTARKLEEKGLLLRNPRLRANGSRTSNVYQLLLEDGFKGQMGHVDLEASFNTREELSSSLEPKSKSKSARRAAPRERDDLWDALVDLFGDPTTETSRKLRGKMVRSLRSAGADGAEVLARAKQYERVMPPGTMLTETALEKHWPLLSPPKAPNPPCPDCGMGGGLHVADCPRAIHKAKAQ